ncbi:NADPH-dependent F420 reductase [Rathayibacter sp. Leaf296]|uniref:NADPH-dependent F420 reductase n=1 Tax=Rathayibacter sp. Leaf296 TaxID=1736327 RepID=UPI0007029BD2|nr:NADPH-dependent F420 reductase [Rathayibacter sp. Leaf296]KQQ08228.1 oxidoreductase [Rathayibacter sp. Leaf296]
MNKTLGIIGSGAIGSILARQAVAAGLDVVLSNSRGPESLAGLVAELGPRARAATPVEAAEAGDLVVVSVPMNAYQSLPVEPLVGKIVIDTLNYYTARDGHIAELDANELTSSELLQRHLTGARVVKAASNIVATQLAALVRPSGAADRSAMPIAGDDEAAKAEVVELLDLLGYDAVDIGTLADSWRSEPGTPVYCKPYFGVVPADVSADKAMDWIYRAPGVPTSVDRVRELTRTADRPAGGSFSIASWM